LNVDYKILVNKLKSKPDPNLSRNLYLSLGTYTGRFARAELDLTEELNLADVYRHHPDSGIHGAAQWLLMKLGQSDQIIEISSSLTNEPLRNGHYWYINSVGQSMTVLGPATFLMGSPHDEPGRESQQGTEDVHTKRIDRVFAIAATETTNREFQLSRNVHAKPNSTVDPNVPVHYMSWNDAARYCNWLSKRDGLSESEFCYFPDADNAEQMLEVNEFLKRSGYRLPTEAEWEFACRGNSSTAWFFGSESELVGRYAWCSKNSSLTEYHAVGQLTPNPFGLFDLYGNVAEWCGDIPQGFVLGSRKLDRGGPRLDTQPTHRRDRIIRGGGVGDGKLARSASRDRGPYDVKSESGSPVWGFRVARTIPSTRAPNNEATGQSQ
jgi:hypothetical protein